MKHSIAVICGLVSVALAWEVSARTQTIRVWRGETVTALVEDFAELGGAPDGIAMRTGVIRPVKYSPRSYGMDIQTRYDRVEWGATGAGPRIVEISVPPETPAGTYRSGALEIHVVDRVLPPPSEWKTYLDLWQHPWAVARIKKVKPFSPEHYAAMRPVYELLATAGQKTITVSILDEPWDHQCRDAYHSLVDEPDFRTFDEYVEFCLSCGLGPDISCYSLCPWKLKEKPGTPEFESRWTPFLRRFAAHLKEKGWYDRTLMAMDERAPDQVRAVVDFVHRVAPGMRVSMAGNRKPSDFDGITIDSYSQYLSDMTTDFLKEIPARRAKGLVTTFYVCCGPVYPNTFMTSGFAEPFWLGSASAMLGLDGFLRWAWNSWPEDPVENASFGWWRAGDTFLCYPDGSPSIRFLELRNGLVVSEKVRILREAGLFTKELDGVAALYDVKKAVSNSCDFDDIRRKALEAVNRD